MEQTLPTTQSALVLRGQGKAELATYRPIPRLRGGAVGSFFSPSEFIFYYSLFATRSRNFYYSFPLSFRSNRLFLQSHT